MNISQEITRFLGDSTQWRGFGEILNDVGNKITAEKASQIYASSYAENQENSTKDTEEKVRLGRRKMIARALSQMVHAGYVECQDTEKNVHERVYRKGSGKKTLLANTPDELIQLLEEAQEGFERLGPTSYEQQDFKKDIRSLKRIILCLKKRSDG